MQLKYIRSQKTHGTPVFPQLSNEKNPGWLGYIEDYNKPPYYKGFFSWLSLKK